MVQFDDCLIAGNPGTSAEVLLVLAETAAKSVRERVAANGSASIAVLEKLVCDNEHTVRACLAENPNLPKSIAERLCSDTHPDVRHTLAENVRLDADLIQRLIEDDNPYISKAASKTMDILYFESMLKEQHFAYRPGESARLGELLVGSFWISKDQMLGCVAQATNQHLPLGQILLKAELVSKEVLVRALKLQSRVRRGEISAAEATKRLAESKVGMPAALKPAV